MKTKFGALMVDGRGKIGGHVASKNRGGNYLRTKVTPVNPQSPAQSAVRAAFTAISQAWRALTNNQRASFNGAVSNFAKTDIFGDLRNPSGANLHQRLNMNLNSVGAAFITDAPALSSSPVTDDFTVAANATTPSLVVSWTGGAIPAGVDVVVEATEQVSPGKSFVKNMFRLIQVLPSGDTSTTAILSAYTAKFGALVAGQKIGFRFRAVDNTTGIVGAYVTSLITVA
jgi:hypothetical protein